MWMWKNYIPFAHADNVFILPDEWLIKHNVKYLLVDLDNTLDSFSTKTPSERPIKLKERLDKLQIKLIILSNNTKKRVSKYADALGVDYINSLTKPCTPRLRHFLKKMHIKKEDAMMVGDQVVTDVICANRIGLRVVLTDRLVKEDQPTTKINRLLDGPLRKRLYKNKKINEWSEV